MRTVSSRAGVIGWAVRRLWRKTGVAGGKFARDLLFPPRCAVCDGDLADLPHDPLLCDPCARRLVPQPWVGCLRCGAPSPPELPSPPSCGWCRSKQLRMDRAVVLGGYRGELREAVLRLKRASGDSLAAVLARLFWHERGQALRQLKVDVVVPVPMFWTRHLARGINNPDIVGDTLARKLRVPDAGKMLYRCRNTLPQADLTPSKRFRNVRGAFRLRAGYDLRGAHVLLVDDILTTGATSSEIARVFKLAGAAKVSVAVLARAGGMRLTR